MMANGKGPKRVFETRHLCLGDARAEVYGFPDKFSADVPLTLIPVPADQPAVLGAPPCHGARGDLGCGIL